MTKLYLWVTAFLFSISYGWAQNNQTLEIAQSYLNAESQKLGFSPSDLEDLSMQTNYINKSNQLEYAYVQQNFGGYPVYNAIANFAIKDGEVVYMVETFEKNIIQRAENHSANQNMEVMASKIAQNLGYILNENAFINSDFTNELVYYAPEDGPLNLSWVIHINVKDDNDFKILEVIAHAQTGEIYFQKNQLLSEGFDEGAYENPMTARKLSPEIQWLENQYKMNSTLNDGAQYRVFELPVEAPTFGDRNLVVNPADPVASPYGWHDTDGQEGPEYYATRGNNVIAVNDQSSVGLNWFYNGGNYNPDDYTINSTEDLNFDFPLNFDSSLYNSGESSTTNLFYMNNMIHDIFYQYGFDEQSGNFQFNNYGNGGQGDDAVYAFGQTGESLGGMNNAFFSSPPDGSNPTMSMYMWTSNQSGGNEVLSINTPGDFQGDYNGLPAGFGPGLPSPVITAELAVIINEVSGGSTDPNDGCSDVTNAEDLAGKIVFIKRGNCNFTEKVKRAQLAGALAVVMVNNEGGAPITMGGTDNTINIPSVMIRRDDGNPIIDAVLEGTELEGSVPKDGYNDGYKDGSFDNGIITHEYGHGISIRLTGGPNNSSCLNNDEQMGEGWSDYFAMMLTMKAGDQGTDGRGMGTYAVSQPTTGVGIRPKRYSTDMSINNSTYNTIKTMAIPHGVGYVWANMLWEMSWELIDEYGFDPNLHTGTGGNNLALQLVVDGLKLQQCRPGFVNGRDAILQADVLNNDGVNQCTIWKAFAKRGLGYSAIQGSNNSTTDGTEAFDMPPTEVLDCDGMSTKDLTINQLTLYPNPARNEFYIITDKAYNDSKVSVIDLTGRTVLKTVTNLSDKKGTINISSLPAGVYVVTIDTTDGLITKKLIVK